MLQSIARHRPSPAMTVALAALFIALGGTSYAAIKLPKNSVGSKQIKPNAITGDKVRDASLFANDFAPGQTPKGPRGDTGEQGPAGIQGPAGSDGARGRDGAPGTAVAYARILDNGTVDASQSKDIGPANVYLGGQNGTGSPGAHVYCFKNLTFTPRNIVVTPLYRQYFTYIADGRQSWFTESCPQPGSVFFVGGSLGTNPNGINTMDFFITIN
jgi:hypothetical protein